ncbi:MAG: TonB family protein [Chitinophagales bacterium]
MMYFALLAASPVLAVLFYKLLFNSRSPEKIQEQYKDKEVSSFVKKYPEADVNSFNGVFLKTGLALSLAFVLYAFSYAPEQPKGLDLGTVMVPDDIEVLPPPSTQVPPPPPPPPPPPQLEVVEDEEVLEDEPEILAQEVEEDTEVENIPEEVPMPTDDVDEEPVIEQVVTTPEEPEIFTIVEDMPEFPGGQAELFNFIGSNVKYPPMARENGIEGTVYVGFVVMENGSIQNVQIKRGLAGGGAGCDAEAMRVVNEMPKWNPGKQRGKPVRVAFTLPIRFKLN